MRHNVKVSLVVADDQTALKRLRISVDGDFVAGNPRTASRPEPGPGRRFRHPVPTFLPVDQSHPYRQDEEPE